MWRYAKIPLVVALLAFLLPWISVTLLNEKLIEASGWDMTVGHTRPQFDGVAIHGGGSQTNYYVAAGLALVVFGLILSLLRRQFAVAVVISSLLAMALLWAGLSQYSEARIGSAASAEGGLIGALAAAAIQVHWHIGYWIAMIALGFAAALAFLAIRDPDVPS